MENLAKLLIALGIGIVALGIAMFALAKLGGGGFKIPGDIYIRKGNYTIYFPIFTCLVISLILTLLINFWSRR